MLGVYTVSTYLLHKSNTGETQTPKLYSKDGKETKSRDCINTKLQVQQEKRKIIIIERQVGIGIPNHGFTGRKATQITRCLYLQMIYKLIYLNLLLDTVPAVQPRILFGGAVKGVVGH